MLIVQAALLYSVNAGASGNRLEVTKRLKLNAIHQVIKKRLLENILCVKR